MTLITKNIYIDRLDDIVNKYSNTYHRITKIKHVDVKPSIYKILTKKIIKKVLKSNW